MLNLNQVHQLKEFFGSPDRYISANIDKVQLEYGITVWSITCVEYMIGATKNLNFILEGNKSALKSFGDVHRPYPSLYRP